MANYIRILFLINLRTAILKSINIQIVIEITIFKHSITVLVFINMNRSDHNQSYAVGEIARVPKKQTRNETSRDATPPSHKNGQLFIFSKHHKISFNSFDECSLL